MTEVKNDFSIELAHIHAQHSHHDEAYIVANVEGLLKIKECIEKAIESGRSSVELFTADGEGYALYTICDNSHWQGENWQRHMLPYRDEVPIESQRLNTDFLIRPESLVIDE